MHYEIKIEFTKKRDKAGKLTLLQNGQELLSKVPVAIPEGLGIRFQRNELTLQETLNTKTTNQQEENILAVTLHSNLDKTIRVKNSQPLFIYQKEDGKLQGDKDLFVLKMDDFNVIKKVLLNPNNKMTLLAEQVSFLWFPEKVEVNATQKLSSLLEFYDLDAKNLAKKMLATDKNSPIGSKIVDGVLKTEGKDKNSIVKSVSTPKEKIKVSTSVPPYSKERNERVHSYSQNRSETLDPFDVYFMHSHPDLAPFYKPNSLYAWMLFMNNNSASNITPEYINSNINKIPGFENVEKADFKFTEGGYSIDLYEKESGKLSTLMFDENQNNISVSDSTHITSLTKDEDNHWRGVTHTEGLSEINYDFMNTSSGVVGNWSSNSNDGPSVGAGFNFDNNFEMSSSLAEPINMNHYNYEPEPIPVQEVPSYEIPVTSTYDSQPSYGYTVEEPTPSYETRYEPPPPPPPPPEETYGWAQTQDSYSSYRP